MSNNNHPTETPATQTRAERKQELSQVDMGGIATGQTNMRDIIEMSNLMAQSAFMVPPAFRDNPGACAGIVSLAVRVRMDPFAVASKAYVTSSKGGDKRIAYEAQFITSLVNARAPIQGRIKYDYTGEGDTRQCRAYCIDLDGEELEYTSPPINQISVKNSPLWKADPDQQLAYFAGRSLGRRHFPDVLMGVYSAEEVSSMQYSGPDNAKDITPRKTLQEKLDAQSEPEAKEIEDAAPDAPKGEESAIDADAEEDAGQGDKSLFERIVEDIEASKSIKHLDATLASYADQISQMPQELQKKIAQASQNIQDTADG